jgi:hypothetical protein
MTQDRELVPAPYEQIRKNFAEHPVRHAEVPIEHAISLPMPTLRWSLPCFAGFAGAAVRVPNRPLRLAPPDRWWALHAEGRRLIGYGLTSALPFSEDLGSQEAVVDRSGRSLADLEEDLRLLNQFMDQVVPLFFAGSRIDPIIGGDLLEALSAYVTDAVEPWYRELAPDFFRWMEGTPT